MRELESYQLSESWGALESGCFWLYCSYGGVTAQVFEIERVGERIPEKEDNIIVYYLRRWILNIQIIVDILITVSGPSYPLEFWTCHTTGQRENTMGSDDEVPPPQNCFENRNIWTGLIWRRRPEQRQNINSMKLQLYCPGWWHWQPQDNFRIVISFPGKRYYLRYSDCVSGYGYYSFHVL